MMRVRLGLLYVLNDPFGLIYTPVIFNLICMYFTQYWLPPHMPINCYSIIIHVMMIYNLLQIVNT